ncbi:MAG: UDP-N-acetylmuramoyl-L-alanine--D-glutamate ligase, partial [Actinobacteria bacterium]
MSAREPLRGKILVLGLGGSGYAAAEYCARHAAAGDPVTVVAVDEADTPALRKTAACLRALGVEVLCGTAETSAADLAVASPGIPPHSELMRSAREKAPEVVSEIEFAFRRSVSPWVAVTGTNGKTTTTSLVAHLLRDAGIAAEAVGNIGPAAIAAVDDAGPATVLVAEVSSFQLALVSTFRPKVSVLLNVTPDHVNWHGSLEAYAADKARIFENQGPGDTAVVDVDDPGSARYADGLAAQGVAVRRVSVAGLPAGGAGVDGATLVLDTDTGPEPLCGIGDLLLRGS